MRRLEIFAFSLLLSFYASAAISDPPAGNSNNKKDDTNAESLYGCQPEGTPRDDTIECFDVDVSGVAAGRGNDQVTIHTGAVVTTIAVDPNPDTIVIDAGDGDDIVISNGSVVAEVISSGNGLKSIPASGSGKSPGPGSALDDEKSATAVGIDGAAGDDDISITGDITSISTTVAGGLSTGPLASDALALSVGVRGGDGEDTILNNGIVTAIADTAAIKGNISTGRGLSSSNDSSTSAATAIGIDGGAGSDDIDNQDSVFAIANSLIIRVGEPDDAGDPLLSSASSGNTAEATATGVSGAEGDDTIDNLGNIDAVANAATESITVSVSAGGVRTTNTSSAAKSSATAIDSGDGDDTVTNQASLSATATSVSLAQGAAVSDSGANPFPRSTWKGETIAESLAVGVNTGAGNDNTTNNDRIRAVATSVTGTSTVTAAASDVKAAVSTSKAKAEAVGVDAGAGDDTVTNNGAITAVSTATASAIDLVLSQEGKAKAAHEGGPTAEANATGISGDGSGETNEAEIKPIVLPHRLSLTTRLEKNAATGSDTITNADSVTAVATAVSAAASGAISISGAATSEMRSVAKAMATGIDSGAGDDTVTNNGEINTVSSAIAGAVSAGFSESGKATVKGGPEAEATAVGISGDGGPGNEVIETTLDISTKQISTGFSHEETAANGADVITNTGNVSAVATAVSGSEGAAISISGAASADTKAKAKSTATAVDAGAGDDTVTNSGNLTAVSTAIAGTVGVSFSESDKASVKGGPEAEANAIGISADGTGRDDLFETSLVIDLQEPGLEFSIRNTSDAARGADNITNNNNVTAIANALSGSAGAAVSISGAASADTESSAKSIATAVDAGAGDDTVTNNGNLTAVSTATAGAVGVTFSESKDSSAEAGATAEAIATGISGDGEPGNKLTEARLSVSADSLEISFRHENNAATGADEISNNDDVTAVATAVSGAGNVGISVSGGASVDTESTTKALAVGIDAGAGDDTVTNNGAVTAVSTATSVALGVAFSESGGGEVKGGPEAEAVAVGISGDSTQNSSLIDTSLRIDTTGVSAGALYQSDAAVGADTIKNTSAVTTVATAISGTEGLAVSISDAASADVGSEATSSSTTLDGGSGNDLITNNGVLTAVSTSIAGTVGGSISEKKGASADASATAQSEAIGIAGDGGLQDSAIEATLDIDNVNGVNATFRIEQTGASGDDVITNTEVITAESSAISASGAVALSVEKAASADASSTAKSVAKAIDGGGGHDTIENSGVLTAVSTATAGEIAAAISMKGNATGVKSIWKGGAESEALATGISGDSTGKDFSSTSELDIGFTEQHVIAESHTSYRQAGDDDVIDNNGVITATAVATTVSADIAVALEDMAAAVSTSDASSTAIGMDGGTGNDMITNDGVVVSTSVATATTANVAVSKKASLAADTVWNGGTAADAKAVGISGDGEGRDFAVDGFVGVTGDGVLVSGGVSSTTVSGDDHITNKEEVVVTSIAATPAATVAVSVKDAGAAISAANANSSAVGIDAGSGNDTVINHGALVVTSGATAIAANVAVSKSVAVAGNSFWDGGTTAEAEAIGISGDGEGRDFDAQGAVAVTGDAVQVGARLASTEVGGNDDITNDAAVTATSVAIVPSLSVAVTSKGVSASVSAATANSVAMGIDAGSSDDIVDNDGVITASAIGSAVVGNVAVTGSGVSAAWDGGTSAEAVAVGISGDGNGRDKVAESEILVTDDVIRLGNRLSSTTVTGNDTIENDSVITASSVAVVPSANVAVSAKGVSAAISDATATAKTAGIDAGAGDDYVNNSGVITTTSAATAAAVNVAVTGSGVTAAWDGSTIAEAESVGISGDGEGQDRVAESSVEVTEDAVLLSARLASTEVSGNDTIINEGVITTTSAAATPSLSVAVTPSGGLSAAITSAEARSRAVNIDAGSGSDIVENHGVLTASAAALAGSVSVAVTGGGVSVAGNSIWDGGTNAEAVAIGIDGDGEGRDQLASADIDITTDGVVMSSELSDKAVTGNDSITNTGVITATSLASSTSVGVSVTLSGGVSAAVSTSTASSRAVGINGGSGDDIIDNQGVVTATAVGNANTLAVAYATAGVAVASDAVMDGGTTAAAEAIGIDGDGEDRDLSISSLIEVNDDGTTLSGRIADEMVTGNDDITNTRAITASAASLAPSAGVAVTPGGLSVALTTSTAKSRSAAIDAGSGHDIVDNTGTLTATSGAIAVAVPIAVTPAGVALAADAFWDGGTTAEADAIGISGDGVGTDFVSEASLGVNDGDVSIYALHSESIVSGDDTIMNDGTVTATAAAEALSVAVSVTPAGLAVAASTSTADSRSAAIDAGSGDDYVNNSGTLTSTSVANANALSVAVTPAGLSVASGPVWDGGTHANADAIGISGDGEGRDHASEFSVEVDELGTRVMASDSWTTVTGEDEIINSGSIVATAVAVAPSIGVAITPAGVSVASSTATATSRAAAIDAGSGDDDINNTGDLVATSVANADAVSVTVTPAGVTVSADSVWNGGTTAESEAIGISGDGEGRDDTIEASVIADATGVGLSASDSSLVVSGDDSMTNSGSIDAVAVSAVPSIGVAVTPAGLSVALSQATTTARAAAIDAGAGDDFVDNSGDLAATATSVSVAIPVAVTPAGVAIAADAVWDGGTSADAEAVGIAGDGEGTDFVNSFSIGVTEGEVGLHALDSSTVVSGDDMILNDADVSSTAVAVAASVGVSVTPAGVSVSASSATANARAAAIDAGSGADFVDNDGNLTSVATAVAAAVPVAVAPVGFGVALDAVWDGGTSAEASAIGIDADGQGTDSVNEATIRAGEDGTLLQTRISSSTVSGDDEIDNTGTIDASAVAVAPSVAFSLGVVGGVSAANATTDAYAAAINAGAGNDQIDNTAHLTATSVSNADSVAIAAGALGAAGNNVLDGGTTAEAEAVGISGDGRGSSEVSEFTLTSDGLDNRLSLSESTTVASGEDHITNSGQIDAVATAVTPSLSMSASGAGITLGTSTALSRATSIDAGGADDDIHNEGDLNAATTSVAVAANLTQSASIGIAADAVWDGGTTAEAEATGISGDGMGTDESMTRTISITEDRISFSEQTTENDAFGDDKIYNSGTIDAEADAVSVSVGVAVGVGGAVALSTSTARSDAAAIDAGGGSDSITNDGALTADANAVAVAASVSVSAFGVSASLDAVWDGGTTAEAEATGIDGDGNSGGVSTDRSIEVTADGISLFDETVQSNTDGNDEITNTSTIDAIASSNSTSVGVSTTLIGVAGAIATSTADSIAAAIRAGDGTDEILNQGALTATSIADADGVAVTLTPIGGSISTDSFWDGGTSAGAFASGIHAGGGDDSVTNESAVTATSAADAASTNVAVTIAGVAAAFSEATADARATAIDGAAGDDAISNSGELTAMSSADARGTSVSVGLVGFAASDSSAIANAESIGIDSGDGDNSVENSADIVAAADASATGASITVEIVGVGVSDRIHEGETRADAYAAGLVGGDGTDDFTNDAAIMLGSNAEISADSVTVNLIGFSGGDTSATAESSITGMDGGGAADSLVNNEMIAGAATSNAPARTVSVGLIGASSADASTAAVSSAIGMDGGEDDDGVYNLGVIGLSSEASGEAKSVTVTLAGAAHADAETTATANATGMAGGDGVDEVFNFGGIGVSSTATADALGTSVDIIGVASQSASSTSTATAVGLNGGAGDDAVANTSLIQTLGVANANVSNAAWNLIGASSQQGLVTATANSSGMAGDSGDDVLFNEGEVDVDVNSTLFSDGSVTAAIGGAFGNASLAGTLRGFGMAGGDGDDQILNAGLVSVDSSMVSSSSGTAWNLLGFAGGTAGMTSDTSLTGLAGGAGDDLMANTGTVSVGASSAMNADDSSWTFAGASDGAGSLFSATLASGMSGGGGVDWIHNEGVVDVDVVAALNAIGGTDAIFGSADSSTSVRANATAFGLDGGDDNDVIENLWEVNVDATAILDSVSASFALIGSTSASASLVAMAHSTGMNGGIGSDQIYNGGTLMVGAEASGTSTGGAQTTIEVGNSSTNVVTITTTSANTVGARAGAGDDAVVNTNVIDVTATTNPVSESDADVSGFFIEGVTRAHTRSVSDAQGVDLGDGMNMFLNDGSVSVLAGGTGSSNASSSSNAFSVLVDATSNAEGEISAARASGVTGGDDANRIYNLDQIDVESTVATEATANSDGSGLSGGAGVAHAEANANAINTIGIDTGHGNSLIGNTGEIIVSAGNTAVANATSDTSGINFFNAPNSRADTEAFANDVQAFGIRVGNGDNMIWSGGAIAVTTAPDVYTSSNGLSTDFGFAVDSFADAVSAADNAHAFGIHAGNGANTIYNAGTIDATSAPHANAMANAVGRGWDGDAEATAIATANGALAVGIFAGDGGSLVVNQGAIYAMANPTATVTATATPGGAELAGAVSETVICTWTSRWRIFQWILEQTCRVVTEIADGVVDDGETVVVRTTEVDLAEAMGIWTGNGNDAIVNYGSIETAVIAGAVNRHGIAISSGAGNDTVILQDGSTITGDVDLGADDDFLYLLGTTNSIGDFYGRTGMDQLLVDGTSTINGGAFGFEKLKLYGTSNFTLNALQSVSDLNIHEGTLNVLGNYSMASTGNFNVYVNSDGSHGQLNVGGNVTLGGALRVSDDAGPYTDGTTYDIVTAGSVSGSFASEHLPAPTTLVSFSLEQSPTDVNVVADVTPFAAMANGASETAVAEYLDAVVPDSTGDLSVLLAEMQEMSEEDFGDAFRSLDPSTYDTYQVTDRIMRHHLAGTRNRLAQIRATLSGNDSKAQSAFMSAREPLYLSTGNFDTQISGPQYVGAGAEGQMPVNAWSVGYTSDYEQGSAGSSLQGAGFTTMGFSMGFDNAISDNFVAGISFGTAFTKSDIDGGYGEGEFGSSLTSFYATYLPSEDSYIEAIISRSENYFANQRNIAIGPIERDTLSGHQGELLSALVEAGKTFDNGWLKSEVFGSLYYSSMKEDGFEETGAGAINIIVDPRDHQTVSSELGWRGSLDIETRNGKLSPLFDVAYIHNFDVGDEAMSVRFSGAPDLSFSPAGRDISGSGVRMGLGLNFVDDDGWTVYTQLGGEISGRRRGVGGTIQLSREF